MTGLKRLPSVWTARDLMSRKNSDYVKTHIVYCQGGLLGLNNNVVEEILR